MAQDAINSRNALEAKYQDKVASSVGKIHDIVSLRMDMARRDYDAAVLRIQKASRVQLEAGVIQVEELAQVTTGAPAFWDLLSGLNLLD